MAVLLGEVQIAIEDIGLDKADDLPLVLIKAKSILKEEQPMLTMKILPGNRFQIFADELLLLPAELIHQTILKAANDVIAERDREAEE